MQRRVPVSPPPVAKIDPRHGLVHRQEEGRDPRISAQEMADAKRLGDLDYLLRRVQQMNAGPRRYMTDFDLP
jgi:hypothetical protein